MIQKNFSLKSDHFRSSRGPWARIVNIYCRRCKHLICVYQKDGSGNIRRLYFDRIYTPANLMNLQDKKITDIAPLKCDNCREIIGTPFIYAKENRKAFRVYQDAIVKAIRKGKS